MVVILTILSGVRLMAIVSAGFDVVLLDQVPDDLLERDSPCRQMQA